MTRPTRGLVTLGETMAMFGPAEPGPSLHTRRFLLGIGGSESNVAIGVRRLDVPATWFGRVGRDELGDLILRELRAEQIAVHAVRDDAPTGVMLKLQRTSEISRVIYYRFASAGSRLSVDDLREDVIREAAVLHVTGITLALGDGPAHAVHAAVEIARAAHVPVSVDLNYRAGLWTVDEAAPALTSLVRRADIVFAGEHEAALIADNLTPPEAAAALARLGPTQVVIKRGRHGCVALIDGVAHTCPAAEITVADPVGAGDAFVAGYLADLIGGEAPGRRLLTATSAAAFALSARGDWEGLPTRHELAFMHAREQVIR